MPRMLRILAAPAGLAALVLLLALPGVALAHEHREVGKYELVVGWANEPAFAGQQNGLSLRVTNTETKKPVEGLEKSLKAEVIFGGQRREVELRPVFGQPGSYVSHLVPTREGDYRFRFFGTIEGAQLNETFDSADGKFNQVQSIQAIQFPEAVPAAAQVNQAAQAAEQKAIAAQRAAVDSQTLGIAGLVVGALGLLLGGLALAASARRARPASRVQSPGGRVSPSSEAQSS